MRAIRAIHVAFLFLLLAGCASTHTVTVQYGDITPKVVVATVTSETHNPFGQNVVCKDRYLVDKDGSRK